MIDLGPHHVEERETTSLRSNSNQDGENDGDHQAQPLEVILECPKVQSSSKEVMKIQEMARNIMEQLGRMWPDSSGN